MNTNFDSLFDRQWHAHHSSDQAVWGDDIQIQNVSFRCAKTTYRMNGSLSASVHFDLGDICFERLDIHSIWMPADEIFSQCDGPELDAAYAAAQIEWDAEYDNTDHPCEWDFE